MRILTMLLFLVVSSIASAADEGKITVLIIDGQNNHAWPQTTPVLKKQLEAAGKFTVEVATSPPAAKLPPRPKNPTPEEKKTYEDQVSLLKKAARKEMEKFQPDVSKHHVVVSNYNGDPWSTELNEQFERLLKDGKIGYVVVHAANNAFENWNEYNHMIGMGWRGAKGGERLFIDLSGGEVIVPSGEGDASGHRYTGPFTVTIRNAQHPVTKGMPREWLHVRDELYDNMRGPIRNVKVLATALSEKEKKGTGFHEPMIWTVDYGKGRVFHTPMGHDANAMRCHGFAATFTRGAEWAATGKVTIPLPAAFPTADKASPIPDK